MYSVYLDFEDEIPIGLCSIFPIIVGVSYIEAYLTWLLYNVIYDNHAYIINRETVTNHADFERENPDLSIDKDGFFTMR